MGKWSTIWGRRQCVGAILLLTALLTGPRDSQAQPTFSGVRAENVSARSILGNPIVVVADFDEDGKPDIAVTHNLLDQVHVGLGDGVGGFHSVIEIPVVDPPRAVETGDWNSDGHADLLVLHCREASVQVLLGDGRGAFQAGDIIPVLRCPNALAVGDFNGDGTKDFAVGGNCTEIYLGNGDGTFALGQELSQGGLAIYPFDVDLDGALDLLIRATGVLIYRGDGSGGFSLWGQIDGSVGGFHAGDFDGDGIVDFVVTRPQSRLEFLRGDGSGGFTLVQEQSVQGAGGLVSDDFDGDGRADLAVNTFRSFGPQQGSSFISILMGRGDGTFRLHEEHDAFGRLTITDLDLDGRKDILSTSGVVMVLMGLGQGRFAGALRETVGQWPRAARVADFNQDGLPDVVVAKLGQVQFPEIGGLTILLGVGGGGFVLGSDLAPDDRLIHAPAPTDVNEDGFLDLVWSEGDFSDVLWSNSDSVKLALGDGTGGFGQIEIVETGLGGRPVEADLNEDGHGDIVLREGDDRLGILLGDGDRFDGLMLVSVGRPVRDHQAGDLNGDGHVDLVVNVDDPPAVAALLGDGRGAFTPAGFVETGIPIPARPQPTLVLGDLDGDRVLDALSWSTDSTTIAVLFGDGNGSFGEAVDLDVGFGADDVRIGDFDEDGNVDLAVSRQTVVYIYQGLGAGGFRQETTYVVGQASGGLIPFTGLTTADFDGDGHLDIGAAVKLGYSFSVLFNTTFDPNPAHCPRGRVNLGQGPVTDVLFINGETGTQRERRLVLDHSSPFQVTMEAPPAVEPGGTAPFALYALRGEPRLSDFRVLPLGLGQTCIPMPLSETSQRLKAIWNNTGRDILGLPTLPSQPAPSEVLFRPAGFPGPVRFFLQGIVFDPGSSSALPASVTNGIFVELQ